MDHPQGCPFGGGGGGPGEGSGGSGEPHNVSVPPTAAADAAGEPVTFADSSQPDPSLAAGVAAPLRRASLGGGVGTPSERMPLSASLSSHGSDSQLRNPRWAAAPATPHVHDAAVANATAVAMGPFATDGTPPSVSLASPLAERFSVAVDAPVPPPPPPPTPPQTPPPPPPPSSEGSRSFTNEIEWMEVTSPSRRFFDGGSDPLVTFSSDSESSSTANDIDSSRDNVGLNRIEDEEGVRGSATAVSSGDWESARGHTSAASGAAAAGRTRRRRRRRRDVTLPAATAARVAMDIAQLRRERLPFVAVAWEGPDLSRVCALVIGPLETSYAVR